MGMINDADIPPPEAVIATLYVSLAVLFRVETMKNAVLKPPEVSVTDVGLVEL